MATMAKNAVGQYASFTGTGVVTLAGAALEGARAFAAAYADGATFIPVALQEMDSDGARGLPVAWELVECTFDATTNTLTRGALIYASSNGGARVNFGAGLKRAFMFLPAQDVANAATLGELSGVTDSIPLVSRQTAQTYTAVRATTDFVDLSLTPPFIDGFDAESSELGDVYVLAGQGFDSGAYLSTYLNGFTKLATFSGAIQTGTHAGEYWVCGPNSAIKLGVTVAHTQALSTITQSGAAVGDNPRWSGTAWVPAAPSVGGGGITAIGITDSTAAGRALLTAANATTQRTTLGLGTAATLNVAATGNAASGEVVKGNDTRLGTGSGSTVGAYLALKALHAWPLDEATGTRFDRKGTAHLLEVGGAVGSAIVGGRRVLSTSGGASYLSATNAGGLLIGSPNKLGIAESGRTYCFWTQQVNNSMPVVLLPYPATLRFYISGASADIYPHGALFSAMRPQAWMFVCVSLGGYDQVVWNQYGIPTLSAPASASDATEINVGNSPVFGSPPLQMRDLMIFNIGPDKFRQEHYEFMHNSGAGRHWSELV